MRLASPTRHAAAPSSPAGRRLRGRWAALIAVVSLPLHNAGAQEEARFGRHWGVYGALAGLSWDGLRDVRPLGRGGPFDTTGSGLLLGGYTSVARVGSVWVLAGVELGRTGFNYDTIFASSGTTESALELNFVDAAVRLRFGETGGRYLDLEVAAGPRWLDSKYIDCSVITSCFAADTGSSAAGLTLGVSGMVGPGVILGARVQRVDFDPIEAIDLGAASLDGPIYSLFVGWELGSWKRDRRRAR